VNTKAEKEVDEILILRLIELTKRIMTELNVNDF